MNVEEHEEYYRDFFRRYELGRKDIQKALNKILNKIKFLESIYVTGADNNHFSKSFHDSAYKERQELCQQSSALYNILNYDQGIS